MKNKLTHLPLTENQFEHFKQEQVEEIQAIIDGLYQEFDITDAKLEEAKAKLKCWKRLNFYEYVMMQ